MLSVPLWLCVYIDIYIYIYIYMYSDWAIHRKGVPTKTKISAKLVWPTDNVVRCCVWKPLRERDTERHRERHFYLKILSSVISQDRYVCNVVRCCVWKPLRERDTERHRERHFYLKILSSVISLDRYVCRLFPAISQLDGMRLAMSAKRLLGNPFGSLRRPGIIRVMLMFVLTCGSLRLVKSLSCCLNASSKSAVDLVVENVLEECLRDLPSSQPLLHNTENLQLRKQP